MSDKPKGLHNQDDQVKIGKFWINSAGFLSRLVENKNGCEVWTGAKHRQGYGMYNLYNTELKKKKAPM